MTGQDDIAVVGGGSIATTFLAQFVARLERAGGPPRPVRVRVFEPAAEPGRGEPYADDLSTNLLNIPAGRMSAYAADRGHFLRWLSEEGAGRPARHGVSDPGPDDFLPRPLFGEYLAWVHASAVARGAALGIEIERVPARVDALDLAADGTVVLEAGGRRHAARRAVLCNGNLPSVAFAHLQGRPGYFNDPYPVRRLVQSIDPDAAVGVLGTSLSAIDAIVSLKEGGHRGPILAVSRNGRLPAVRSIVPSRVAPQPFGLDEALGLAAAHGGNLTLRHVYDWLCARVTAAGGTLDPADMVGRTDGDALALLDDEIRRASTDSRLWQAVAASLNEVIEHVWRLLPEGQRRAFHADWRSLWMARRATFPMANARKLKGYLESGQLRVAGGFRSCTAGEGAGFALRLEDAGRASPESCRVDFVVNATSFSLDVARSADPLVRSLLARGLASPDPFGGFLLDHDTGCLLRPDGVRVESVSLLGSLAAGTYFWTSSLDVNARLADGQARRLAGELAPGREVPVRAEAARK